MAAAPRHVLHPMQTDLELDAPVLEQAMVSKQLARLANMQLLTKVSVGLSWAGVEDAVRLGVLVVSFSPAACKASLSHFFHLCAVRAKQFNDRQQRRGINPDSAFAPRHRQARLWSSTGGPVGHIPELHI